MEGIKQKVEKMNIEIMPNDSEKYDLIFKLVVIGNSDVGKRELICRGSKKCMPEDMEETIGFEHNNFDVRIGTDVVRLQIWDTCGQEIYKSVVSNFFRQVSCALLVYSIDNMQSFEDLIYWLNNVKNKSNNNVKIILIGNNNDLEDQRQVSTSDGEGFKRENNLDLFFEASPRTGYNIEKVFIEAAKLLYTNYKSNQKDNNLKQNDDTPK